VFKKEVKSILQLKRSIIAAAKTVTPQMLRNTWNEIKLRLERVQEIGGVTLRLDSVIFVTIVCYLFFDFLLLFINKELMMT